MVQHRCTSTGLFPELIKTDCEGLGYGHFENVVTELIYWKYSN